MAFLHVTRALVRCICSVGMMVFNKLSVVHFPAVLGDPEDPVALDGDAFDGDVGFHHPDVGKTERRGI